MKWYHSSKVTVAVYEDGSHVLFLNSHYTKANAGPAIIEYLDYVRTNDDSVPYETELLHKTVEKVQEVRSDDKMEVSYMMWQLKYQDAVEEGRAEGRVEGRAEGIATGIVTSIKNLMRNTGWPVEQALSTLGVPEEEWTRYTNLIIDQ